MWVNSGLPTGRPVHSDKRGFIRLRVVVIGFIRVVEGSLVRVMVQFGSARVNVGAPTGRGVPFGSCE